MELASRWRISIHSPRLASYFAVSSVPWTADIVSRTPSHPLDGDNSLPSPKPAGFSADEPA